MKKIGLALILTNLAVSAMAVELERVDLAALGKMELPAVTAQGIKPEKAAPAAEAEYVRYNLNKRMGAKVRQLLAQEPLAKLSPAKSAELYRKALAALKKEKDPSAPGKAFDTLIYVEERLSWVRDAAAEMTGSMEEYARLVSGPAERIGVSVMNADSLALMRSDADIIAGQFLNNRSAADPGYPGARAFNEAETGAETLERLGAEITAMQIKYRAADLEGMMAMKPALEALLGKYADCQSRLIGGARTCPSSEKAAGSSATWKHVRLQAADGTVLTID